MVGMKIVGTMWWVLRQEDKEPQRDEDRIECDIVRTATKD